MNILPLIFTFLIIFSCINSTLMRDLKSYALMETALKGYYRAERAVNNCIVKKAYKKIKGEPLCKKEDSENQQTKKHAFSRRTSFPPLELSKFNLDPLVKGGQEWKLHPLYEPMAELLRLLYQKTLFEKVKEPEKIAYRLIDEMVKKARGLPVAENLSSLFPDDPLLRKLYYKMLKGTNQYGRDRGIPPLGHFFCVDRGDKAIALSFASPLLLEALFGPEISSEILNLEQKKGENSNKNLTISKEELQSLCIKSSNKTFLLTALDTYLDDSKKFIKNNQIGGRDPITGIAIEKML